MVTNPNIGYGQIEISYADGSTKQFYRIGLSATQKGISVYIMGLDDKTFLPTNFSGTIGKAKVTGYCIAFKSVNDIDLDVLQSAILYGADEMSRRK